MKDLHLWNFIHLHLKKNNPVILVAVVDHKKGSPGKQGFKMAVSSSGDSVGSIGGGIMEYNIIKECKDHLNSKTKINKIVTLYHYPNKESSAKKSGLICSGSQTNFMLSLGKKDLSAVTKILNAYKNFKPGKIIFDLTGIRFKQSKKNIPDYYFKFKTDKDWIFEQATGKRNIVYVVGSGHVGLAVCKVLSMLDFYVIVFDTRDDLKTFTDNTFADEKIKGEYKDLKKIIAPDSFVIIVTTGFESDKEAIKQVIKKNVKYLGLMGTKAKIKKIFNELVKDGISKKQLERIHAPIGLDINSDTPEEIAVSIAAEIIKVKNEN